jgi:hypothetical protein
MLTLGLAGAIHRHLTLKHAGELWPLLNVLVERQKDAGQFAPQRRHEFSQGSPRGTVNPKKVEASVDTMIGCHGLYSRRSMPALDQNP